MPQTRTFVIRALVALAIAHGAAAQTAPTVVISPVPMIQFFDNSGRPLAGGCVATYQAGTTTAMVTYTDATGMVANQNPVILDAAGRAPIWIKMPSIKYVVKAKSTACSLTAGTILYTVDHVQDSGLLLRADLAGANGGGLIGYTPPGGTVPGTIADALNAKMLDTGFATPAAACGAAQGTGKTLLVTKVWNAMPTQTCAANLEFATGGMFQPASGQTVTFSGVVAAAPIQIFDISSGGVLLFSNAATTVEAAWFGNAGGAFSAAVASLPAGGTLHLDAGFNSTVTTGAALSKTGVRIRCEAGALLTAGFNGAVLTITGGGAQVTGCPFAGNRTANPTWAAPAIAVGTASTLTPNVTFDGIAVTDDVTTATTTGNWGVYAMNTPNLKIRNSRIISNGGVNTNFASGPIEVEATGAGNNSDGVSILNNYLENPVGCPVSTTVTCGNVIRMGKTDSSNATIDNFKIQGNTIKNGAGRISIEIFSAGHDPAGNWPMIYGGNISGNHFIDTGQISMEISLCLSTNTVVANNDFDHGGGYPSFTDIELVNGGGRTVTGNTEFHCGQNPFGANTAVTTDGGNGSGDVVASNSFPCGTRNWFIQAYPSETGRSYDVDRGNVYGCMSASSAATAIISMQSGGEAPLPLTNMTIEGEMLIGTGCPGASSVTGVYLASVGTSGNVNQSPLTGIKVSGNVAIGVTGGLANGSYNGGTTQYTPIDNLWSPSDAAPPVITLGPGAGTGSFTLFPPQYLNAYQGTTYISPGPGTSAALLFTVAAGRTAYSQSPSCAVTPAGGSGVALNVYYDAGTTGGNWSARHTLYFNVTGTPLVNGNYYIISWVCQPI